MSGLAFHPSFDDFRRLAKKGNLIPVFAEVLADHLTPVSLIASVWDRSPHAFLLESVEGGEKLGRYSIVSFEPEAVLTQEKGRTRFTDTDGCDFLESDKSAIEALKAYMACVKPVAVPGLPRFAGGAVGYLNYEIVHGLERVPRAKPDQLGWPEAVFFLTGDLFVFDNTQQTLKIVTWVRLGAKAGLRRAYDAACARVRAHVAMLRKASLHRPRAMRPRVAATPFRSNVERPAFIKAVRRAKEHIGKGDIIQVVLSRRQTKRTPATPLEIYRCLRVVNPSPYMYLFKMNGRAIIGSSPESLVRLEDGVASTRPIAGTRRRGDTVDADLRLEKDLIRDPKEIAEHIMLVDLGRNDLGRVCNFGSVEVPTFMKVERYSHVMHIVSEVTGRLSKGRGGLDLLSAVFPAGTVSGAPKIRAMEIINDLEPCERGPYAGALGYVSYNGNLDMAITIRTILWDDHSVSIQTGAGIVADSDPAREYDETENKARAMKETMRLAESGDLFGERV